MKHNLTTLIFLASLLGLVSCGSGSKSDATLKVSSSFAMSSSTFGGGLIVYGESSTGKKFSMALDGVMQRTIPLDNDTWTIYAVGWDEPIANVKFGGTKYCGYASQAIDSSNSTVTLNVTTTGCSDAKFQGDLKINPLTVVACGAFSSYNTGTNTFSPVTDVTPTNFCSALPLELQSTLTHYRIETLNMMPGLSPVPAFQSGCAPFEGAGFGIPLSKVPFNIKAYRNVDECNSTLAKAQIFHFPNGIDSGNPASFEQLFQPITANLALPRIILPSSITRRGTSPFMTMLPRILCGASPSLTDCFTPGDTSGGGLSTNAHVYVSWMDQWNERVILKNTTLTTCPSQTVDSKYFDIKNCKNEDGNLRAEVIRNEFTCQPTASPFSSVLDIYTRGDKVYILEDGGLGFDRVKVYTSKGKFLRQFDFDSDAVIAVAADGFDNIYALFAPVSTQSIRKYPFDPLFSTNTNSGYIDTTVGNSEIRITDLDISADGTSIFAGLKKLASSLWYDTIATLTPGGSYVSAASLTVSVLLGPSSSVYTNDVKVKLLGSSILALSVLDAKLRKVLVGTSTLTLDSFVKGPYSGASLFDADTTNYYIYDSVQAKAFKYDYAGTLISSDFLDADAIGVVAGKVLSGLPVGIVAFDKDLLPITVYGSCLEPIAMNPIPGVVKNINFRSNELNTSFEALNDAFRFVGVRNIDPAFREFYFQIYEELSWDDEQMSGGGKLRRISEHLSPAGLAGIIPPELGSCVDIKNRLVAGGVVGGTKSVTEPFTGEVFSVSFSVTLSSVTMPAFVCNAATSCPTGTEKFDVEFKFGTSDPKGRAEKGIMRLKCGYPLGTYEVVETGDGETRRELLLWNTENTATARYEEYSRDLVSSTEYRANVSKFQKLNAGDFVVRGLDFGRSSMGVRGHAMELEKNVTQFLSQHLSLEYMSYANFFSSGDPLLTNATFGGNNVPSCTSTSANTFDLLGTCNLTAQGLPAPTSTTSKNFVLQIDSFYDVSEVPPLSTGIFDPNLVP